MVSYDQLCNETTIDERSLEGNRTESSDIIPSPIPDNYGSTSIDEDKTAEQCYVPTCGLVFYILGFFAFFCALSLRQSLNVAIVDMVNQTTVIQMDILMPNNTDQCTRDLELDYEGGEFNWDRMEESLALSAFYIGRAITIVSKYVSK